MRWQTRAGEAFRTNKSNQMMLKHYNNTETAGDAIDAISDELNQ